MLQQLIVESARGNLQAKAHAHSIAASLYGEPITVDTINRVREGLYGKHHAGTVAAGAAHIPRAPTGAAAALLRL